MVSTYTPNINLEEPARGDQVGTWDTPVNNNMTLVDLVVGGIATISLNNSPVVLSAAQFQARQITFNSTLTGSCAITFPSTFTKSYDIQNLCSGSSAFIITLGTTVAAGQVIAIPFGETIECFNDGSNIKFKGLDRVGTYWDYAGSSVPAWVSGCTVPPYLDCNGGTFSATTYPALSVILGSTTLPDGRGRVRYALNGGTARLSSAGAGIDGNTARASGGVNGMTLAANQIPSGVTSSGTALITVAPAGGNVPFGNGASNIIPQTVNSGTATAVPTNVGGSWTALTNLTGNNSITVTSVNASQQVAPNATPGYVGGVTMIRAA